MNPPQAVFTIGHSDALLARGVRVEHIVSEGARKPHSLTPWARVEGTRVSYPALRDAQTTLPLDKG